MARGWNKQRAFDMEHTRLICYTLAAANRDPKKQFPTLEKFMPLSIDEEKKEESADEVRERTLARIRQLYPKRYKDL